MNTTRVCGKCGAPLPADGPKGFCPACMMEAALETNVETRKPESIEDGTIRLNPSTDGAGIGTKLRYFGDYELLEKIAQGGMGVVYKARQVSLNRAVAVKMILSGQLASEGEVQRFLTEAEAAANLQHPNIVAVHEVGQDGGQYYFSMDFVEGRNLADYARINPVSAVRAAELIKLIAEAIHYAHQRGTLHRDLKPQNVLIDAAGQPHITDFGLAKHIQRDSGLTQTGAVMGSPSYMPPEQAAGKNDLVGPSSDVYSIGAMLYCLLTGRAPFAEETPMATLRKVIEEEPPAPAKIIPKTPPDLETICLKCLEKQPERRYATARALAEELGRFLNHEPILARPASAWRKAWSWSQRNPWAIIGLAALVGIVLLGLAYGLWEQVKYLGGKKHPRIFPTFLIGLMFLLPAVIFGRWLNGRRQLNLPVSTFQLALLAGFGSVLIVSGLWSNMMLIRFYVWWRQYTTLPATVGGCLGLPLLLCWVGGIMIWQAIRRQQAHWSGSTTAEEEWLPRQALRYSTLEFLAATFANLVLFVSIACLGVATGLFDRVLNVVGASRAGMKPLLLSCFVFIALTVSTACWIYATRKVYKRSPLVSIFLGVLLAGAALGGFSWMPAVAWLFVIPAILTGLVGGWVLVTWVKIHQEEPSEPLRPLVLGELFQWDRGAFAMTLTVVVITQALLAGLFFQKVWFPFLFFTVWTALWPALFLAVRATTGKLREFFLSLLVVTSIPSATIFLLALSSGFNPFLVQLLVTIPVGLAAGCALIYFSKIRPKTS